jgi:hypothetical protein
MPFGSVVGGDSGAPWWLQGYNDLQGSIAQGAFAGDWGAGTTTDYISIDNGVIWCLNSNCTNGSNNYWP